MRKVCICLVATALCAASAQAVSIEANTGWLAQDLNVDEAAEFTFETDLPSLLRVTVALYDEDSFTYAVDGGDAMDSAPFAGGFLADQGEDFYDTIQGAWENPNFHGVEVPLAAGLHSVSIVPLANATVASFGLRVDTRDGQQDDVIPEPITMALFGLSAAGAGLAARRRAAQRA